MVVHTLVRRRSLDAAALSAASRATSTGGMLSEHGARLGDRSDRCETSLILTIVLKVGARSAAAALLRRLLRTAEYCRAPSQ